MSGNGYSWFFVAIGLACSYLPSTSELHEEQADDTAVQLVSDTVDESKWMIVSTNITMVHYFESIDSICSEIDSVYHIKMNEYELIHANPRMLDTLIHQDYYIAKVEGRFIYNQRNCIVLHAGDSLHVPTVHELDSLRSMLQSVTIDVNIPEFTLRIYAGDSLVHMCPVRVGKNERKFLAMAGHVVDLRTPIGEGSIIRIERDPWYFDPVDGKRYTTTLRDDGVYTKLPRIPFLEPIIAGRRTGSLLHPTTKLSTLGKAISNGCVGMREADAWIVYYYAPLGTHVRFRYDLNIATPEGGVRRLGDVYD